MQYNSGMERNLSKSDPNVMMGKPVIAGTRITNEFIQEKLTAGETVKQILDAHPRLSREAIETIEDIADSAVIAERREEPTIPHEEFVAELKRDGVVENRVSE